MKTQRKPKFTPRTNSPHYGAVAYPVSLGETCIEGEMMCSDYGKFERRGLVRHTKTKELVRVRLDIPDTYFSIPATTATEHGYVTTADEAGTGEREFEFRPHTEQKVSPTQFRKDTKQAYK